MADGAAILIAFAFGFVVGSVFTTAFIIIWSERRYREDVYKPRDYRCGEPPHYRPK